MGHSKIETTKNIYGHLWAQDRASILDAMNHAVSRLRVYDSQELKAAEGSDVARNAVFHGLSPQTVGQPLDRYGD